MSDFLSFIYLSIHLSRFEGVVDEELVCPICSAVLEDPRLAPECEHAYCKGTNICRGICFPKKNIPFHPPLKIF